MIEENQIMEAYAKLHIAVMEALREFYESTGLAVNRLTPSPSFILDKDGKMRLDGYKFDVSARIPGNSIDFEFGSSGHPTKPNEAAPDFEENYE